MIGHESFDICRPSSFGRHDLNATMRVDLNFNVTRPATHANTPVRRIGGRCLIRLTEQTKLLFIDVRFS